MGLKQGLDTVVDAGRLADERRSDLLIMLVGDGSTRLTDHVDYRLPLGVFGSLADRLLVRHLLERTFAFRQRRSRELLERAG